MKLIASGVTNCAASTRSPSFSRSASSTRMTMRPLRRSSSACSTRAMLSSTAAPYRKLSKLQKAGDVLAEDVGLDVDARSLRLLAPGGGAQRLGNEEEGDAIGVEHFVDGERDPVERDGAFSDHQRREAVGQAKLDAHAFTDGLARGDLADAVDVAENKVAAQAIAESHRPLEVDPVAFAQAAEGGAGERLGA